MSMTTQNFGKQNAPATAGASADPVAGFAPDVEIQTDNLVIGTCDGAGNIPAPPVRNDYKNTQQG